MSELTKNQKISVMIGVILAMLLSALDQTIVATAMPRIAQELNGFEHLSWLFTSYMLASTIIVPIYGKLSDMYGRKYFYISGIVIFLIGSALSGAAQDMTQLIIFRAIQGLGGGAIMVNSFAVIGDIFPPAERSKWQGLIGGVFGLSSVAGPLIGGALTDAGNWRWVFYVNVPVGIIALAVVWYVLPRIVPEARKRSIDVFGAFTMAVSLVCLLLACVWGGTEYAWGSSQIIGLFVGAAVSLVAFIFFESKAAEPILPLELFKSRVFVTSVATTFLIGMGMFGAISYIPLFAQTVIGVNATRSGLILTPMMVGMITSSVFTGQYISRVGKYKKLTIAGLAVGSLGMFLLSQMSADTTNLQLIRNMVIVGLGLGVGMPVFNVIVQSAFDHSKLGVVTASVQLFRSIGGSVGVAIFGTILNNRLSGHIDEAKGNAFLQNVGSIAPQFNPDAFNANTLQQVLSAQGKERIVGLLHQAPAAVQQQLISGFEQFAEMMRVGLADSITVAFTGSAIVMGVAFVITWFLPEIAIRKTHGSALGEGGAELAAELGEFDAADEPELGRTK